MNLSEENLAAKLRNAEEALSSKLGAFTLFGLFEQEDKPGKWDLIASAPYLASNLAGIQLIVDGLEPYFQTAEWIMIRQIVPLRPEEPFVRTMTRLLRPVTHDIHEIGPLFTADYRISRALIITSTPPVVPSETAREALLAS